MASLSELLLAEAPADDVWRLRGAVDFQPDPQLVQLDPFPRQLSDASDDGAPGAPLAESDGDWAFSARVWQDALPHGLGVVRCAAVARYDADALDFFREWAKAEDEYARALGKLRDRLPRREGLAASDTPRSWGVVKPAPLSCPPPYPRAAAAWAAAGAALAAQHTAHTAAAAEMKRAVVLPLQKRTEEADNRRERLLKPVDKVIAEVRRVRATAQADSDSFTKSLASFHRANHKSLPPGAPAAARASAQAAAATAAGGVEAAGVRARAAAARESVQAANAATKNMEEEVQPEALRMLQEHEESRLSSFGLALSSFSSLASSTHALPPAAAAALAAATAALSPPSDIYSFAAAHAPTAAAPADILSLPPAAEALAAPPPAPGVWGWLGPVVSLFGAKTDGVKEGVDGVGSKSGALNGVDAKTDIPLRALSPKAHGATFSALKGAEAGTLSPEASTIPQAAFEHALSPKGQASPAAGAFASPQATSDHAPSPMGPGAASPVVSALPSPHASSSPQAASGYAPSPKDFGAGSPALSARPCPQVASGYAPSPKDFRTGSPALSAIPSPQASTPKEGGAGSRPSTAAKSPTAAEPLAAESSPAAICLLEAASPPAPKASPAAICPPADASPPAFQSTAERSPTIATNAPASTDSPPAAGALPKTAASPAANSSPTAESPPAADSSHAAEAATGGGVRATLARLQAGFDRGAKADRSKSGGAKLERETFGMAIFGRGKASGTKLERHSDGAAKTEVDRTNPGQAFIDPETKAGGAAAESGRRKSRALSGGAAVGGFDSIDGAETAGAFERVKDESAAAFDYGKDKGVEAEDATILSAVDVLLKKERGVGMSAEEADAVQQVLDRSTCDAAALRSAIGPPNEQSTANPTEGEMLAGESGGEWFFINLEGEPVGPLKAEELRMRALAGELDGESWVFQNGTDDWVPAETLDWIEFEPFSESESDEPRSPGAPGAEVGSPGAASPGALEAASPGALGVESSGGGGAVSPGLKSAKAAVPGALEMVAKLSSAGADVGSGKATAAATGGSPSGAATVSAPAVPKVSPPTVSALAAMSGGVTPPPAVSGVSPLTVLALTAVSAAEADSDSMRSGDTEVLSTSEGEENAPSGGALLEPLAGAGSGSGAVAAKSPSSVGVPLALPTAAAPPIQEGGHAAPPIPEGEPAPPPPREGSALSQGSLPSCSRTLAPRRRSRHDTGGKRRSFENDENSPANKNSPGNAISGSSPQLVSPRPGSPPPPPSPPSPLLKQSTEEDFLASLPKSISGRRKRRTERMRRSIAMLSVEGMRLSGGEGLLTPGDTAGAGLAIPQEDRTAGNTAGEGPTPENTAGDGPMPGNTAGEGPTPGNTAGDGPMSGNTAGEGPTPENTAGEGPRDGSAAAPPPAAHTVAQPAAAPMTAVSPPAAPLTTAHPRDAPISAPHHYPTRSHPPPHAPPPPPAVSNGAPPPPTNPSTNAPSPAVSNALPPAVSTAAPSKALPPAVSTAPPPAVSKPPPPAVSIGRDESLRRRSALFLKQSEAGLPPTTRPAALPPTTRPAGPAPLKQAEAGPTPTPAPTHPARAAGPGRGGGGSAVAGLAARFEQKGGAAPPATTPLASLPPAHPPVAPAGQLVDAINSFDREKRLNKVRRQSRRMSAARPPAREKPNAPPNAPPGSAPPGDHVAAMLAKALLQRRAHARLDDTMEREYVSD